MIDAPAERTVAQLLVACLENEGVEYVFGLPGEENLHVIDALADSPIRFVTTRDERGAAFMADTYGALTGKAGVCLATLGPGALNLILGIANAQLDSHPLVALMAQAGLHRLYKESHQVVDLVSLYRPVTKWGDMITLRDAAPEMVRKAFKQAETERPGATFVVLEDLAAARARGATVLAVVTANAWGNVPLAPHRAHAARGDHGSPVRRLLRSSRGRATARCYGAGNGDPELDDWERALLAADLGRRAEAPPTSLAARFGQHGGLGALRVAAGALDAGRGAGPVLVHGIARGGCRTAIVLDAAPAAP